MHHFLTEMHTHVHISVTIWCIVGYGTGALWDLCNRSIMMPYDTTRSKWVSFPTPVWMNWNGMRFVWPWHMFTKLITNLKKKHVQGSWHIFWGPLGHTSFGVSLFRNTSQIWGSIGPPGKITQGPHWIFRTPGSEPPTPMYIWVRSRNCGCLVTWFCYQLIAKPGNMTATVPWPDPYTFNPFPL